MVLEIGSLSEAWRALTMIADESEEVAYDRGKREFENLEIGVSGSITEYFARLHIILIKLERNKIATPAQEVKRTVLGSLPFRFPNETRLYAMTETLILQTWKLGLFGWRSFSQTKSRGTPQPTRWPLPMRAATEPGLEVEPVAEAGKAGARASATTMGVTNNISNRGTLSRHPPGSSNTSSTSHPYGSDSSHNSRPPGSSSDIHSHSSGDRGISRRPGPWANWERPPPRQQFNPWTSSERPPPQQQYRRGGPHPRRRHHRGGDQPHWQQVLCPWCVEAGHFPADCRAAAHAPVPQHRPYAASSFSGAHAAQYDTCPPPPWTSHDSDGHSTPSSYGPPPQHASYALAPPMPPPPRSVGPTPRTPPPSAPPSESDWNFSSEQSQALRAQYVASGEFASSAFNDWGTEEGGVGSSYLPSAFVGAACRHRSGR